MHLTRRILTLTLILSASFLMTQASAQTNTTGTIEGVVSDRHGALIPAVRVTVTSPNLINAQIQYPSSLRVGIKFQF